MKKTLSILMIIVMILSGSSTVLASAEKEPSERMMALISANDDFKLIAEHSHYMYTHLVEDLEEDKVPALIRMIGFYLRKDYATGIPEETYIKVLSDIIISYDLDNAADISAQAQQDDLKGFRSYTMDAKDALVDIVGLTKAPNELAESIKTAIDGLSVLADNLDDQISALYDLDTLVKDYTQYDMFLETIEKSSDGTLKSAASKMRTSLKNAIKLRLEKQEDVLTSTGMKYGYFFMTDIAVDLLKESPDYLNDHGFHTFVDRGDKVCEALDKGSSSLDLGFIIGKTIGNLVVGGENLITRVNELRALDEISHCLSSEATMLRSNTMAALDEEKVDDVIFLNQMLINCRIRGEYSVYSILASDAGLLSWAGMKTKEKALDAYNRQTTVVSDIEKKLIEIRFKDSEIRDEITIETLQSYIGKHRSEISYSITSDITTKGVFVENCYETVNNLRMYGYEGKVLFEIIDDVVVNAFWATFEAIQYDEIDKIIQNISETTGLKEQEAYAEELYWEDTSNHVEYYIQFHEAPLIIGVKRQEENGQDATGEITYNEYGNPNWFETHPYWKHSTGQYTCCVTGSTGADLTFDFSDGVYLRGDICSYRMEEDGTITYAYKKGWAVSYDPKTGTLISSGGNGYSQSMNGGDYYPISEEEYNDMNARLEPTLETLRSFLGKSTGELPYETRNAVMWNNDNYLVTKNDVYLFNNKGILYFEYVDDVIVDVFWSASGEVYNKEDISQDITEMTGIQPGIRSMDNDEYYWDVSAESIEYYLNFHEGPTRIGVKMQQ